MVLDKFVNKLLTDGWLMTKMEGNSVFLKQNKDSSYPWIRIDVPPDKRQDPLITVVHDGHCVFPKIDKRPISDFLEENDGIITCSRTIRVNFLQKDV